MEDLQYVGFWARFWASMVDMVIVMMVIYPIFYLIYGDAFFQKAGDFTLVNILINTVLPFVAILLLWHFKSATPGKMLIKAKIVDASTLEKPSTKQFVIRNIGYLISLLPLGLGYFWAGWDKRKQTWHDKLANTVVVQPKKEKKIRTLGSYLALGVGIFALFAFAVLVLVGTMLQTGMMPDGDLYDETKLPLSVKEVLVEKGIVSSVDKVKYYQPEAMFSFTEKGTVFTPKNIVYFETKENDETLVWSFPLKEVSKLDFKGQKIVLDVRLVTLTLYNNEGEANFAMVLTPRDRTKSTLFQKEILEWWQDERKK